MMTVQDRFPKHRVAVDIYTLAPILPIMIEFPTTGAGMLLLPE